MMKTTRWNLATCMLGVLLLSGCGTDNPIAPGDPGCEHADADGLVVEWAGTALASQWQATVTGAFALADTQSLRALDVVFLAPDSTRMGPGDFCGHSLRWEVADTTIAQAIADPSDPWGVTLQGRNAGATTVRFRVWHNDHPDFTSQSFPVTVTATAPHDPIGAHRAVLFKGGSRISSWRWGVAGSYGKLFVPLGGTTLPVGVQWLDSLENVLDPPAGYTLGWSVADPSRASLTSVAGQPWNVRLNGLTAGHTTVTLSLLWNGVPELTTGPLDIVVADTTAAPTQAMNFVVRKSGIRHIFVENGALVGSCGTTMSTGFLPARVDTSEDLFNFRITTPTSNCSGTTPGSSSVYSLVYEFGDPGIAGVVAHPEHVGEYFDFHLRGLALGSTTLRILLMNGNSVAFRSPPMPVTVTAIGSSPPVAAHEAPPASARRLP